MHSKELTLDQIRNLLILKHHLEQISYSKVRKLLKSRRAGVRLLKVMEFLRNSSVRTQLLKIMIVLKRGKI